MKRSYAIADKISRLTHIVKRNKFTVLIYALICLVFIIIGVVVGIKTDDKNEYILVNGSAIFAFLRGDSGIFAFFFTSFFTITVYAAFSSVVFFNKPLSLLSLAPCMYLSYAAGMQTSIIIAVYSVSALPMLLVLYLPVTILETGTVCVVSFRCIMFAQRNGRCSPSGYDIKEYYFSAIPIVVVLFVLSLIKAVTLALFASALIGVL